MNNNVKKMLGAGAIGVFALITLLNTQAIGKLSNSNNVTYSYQAESANVAAVEENSLFSQVDREDVLAQVGGSGSCNGAVTASAMPLSSYTIPNFSQVSVIYKFRIKNTNTLPQCVLQLGRFEFIALNKTGSLMRNYDKVDLGVVGGSLISPVNPIISYYEQKMQTNEISNISVPPGGYVDLYLNGNDIRNTNLVNPSGTPIDNDYFMVGLSKVISVMNGVTNPPISINQQFDKPIKITP